MINPYVVENKVMVSVLLSCDREDAWRLIGTPAGYAEWFPADCRGSFAVGETITQIWWWDRDESSQHKVLAIEPLHYIELQWEVVEGASVRYMIEKEAPTVISIVASYPKTPEGRAAQLLDVAPWTFAILNLKSVASGGIDLRYHGPKPHSGPPFID